MFDIAQQYGIECPPQIDTELVEEVFADAGLYAFRLARGKDGRNTFEELFALECGNAWKTQQEWQADQSPLPEWLKPLLGTSVQHHRQ